MTWRPVRAENGASDGSPQTLRLPVLPAVSRPSCRPARPCSSGGSARRPGHTSWVPPLLSGPAEAVAGGRGPAGPSDTAQPPPRASLTRPDRIIAGEVRPIRQRALPPAPSRRRGPWREAAQERQRRPSRPRPGRAEQAGLGRRPPRRLPPAPGLPPSPSLGPSSPSSGNSVNCSSQESLFRKETRRNPNTRS